jgi:uncharacterized membrane protein YqjE
VDTTTFPPPGGAPARPQRVAALLGVAADQSRRLAMDYAELATLEARRATMQLALVVSLGLAVTVLVVTAWLALVVSAMTWVLGEGVSWATALAIAAGLNLVGAALLGLFTRGLLKDLPFAATLRQLRGERAAAE